jgi:HSP20 family protein
MGSLQRQMNRLFEDTLAPVSWGDFGGFGKVPAAELNETDKAIEIKLEVPGLHAEDLDIEVTESAVSISGERKSETKEEKEGLTRSEFYYGRFERVIPLPAQVQGTEAKAEYKDGILSLTLPKVEVERPSAVKVEVKPTAA